LRIQLGTSSVSTNKVESEYHHWERKVVVEKAKKLFYPLVLHAQTEPF